MITSELITQKIDALATYYEQWEALIDQQEIHVADEYTQKVEHDAKLHVFRDNLAEAAADEIALTALYDDVMDYGRQTVAAQTEQLEKYGHQPLFLQTLASEFPEHSVQKIEHLLMIMQSFLGDATRKEALNYGAAEPRVHDRLQEEEEALKGFYNICDSLRAGTSTHSTSKLYRQVKERGTSLMDWTLTEMENISPKEVDVMLLTRETLKKLQASFENDGKVVVGPRK